MSSRLLVVEHRTKHIALRYFLARELQQRGQLRLAYVASKANTADIFTKALTPACFALLDWSCDPLFSPTLPMGALPPTLILCAASPIASYSRRLGTGKRVPAAGQGKGLTPPHSPPFFPPPSGARIFLRPSSPAPLLLSRAAAGGGRGTSTRRPCSWGRQGPYSLPLFSLPAAAAGQGPSSGPPPPRRFSYRELQQAAGYFNAPLQLDKARVLTLSLSYPLVSLPSYPTRLTLSFRSGARAFLQPSSSASLLLPRATAGSGVFQRIPAAWKGQLWNRFSRAGGRVAGRAATWQQERGGGEVKVLHTESVKAFDDCLAEILVLGDLRHPNLVQLLGYCMEDSRAILVYELVERGDLHHWLHPNGK
ncbi:unnamed protein product [Closterium sp. NIES-53]